MFYHTGDLPVHLTQVKSLLTMEELGPDGSLGKHSMLMDQGVTGATHGQDQHLLMGAQAPEQNNPKWEGRGL